MLRFPSVVAAFVFLLSAASGQTGLYVSVPAPLSSEGFTRIKNRIDAARAKPELRPAAIVFDFNPNDKDANTPDFGASYELGDFIARLTDITTVGYVHQKVSGHTVLPVLACSQLVFGVKGQLGEIVAPGEAPPTGARANGYTDVLGAAHPAYLALARKMYDRDVTLRKAKKGTADWFVDLRERTKWEKEGIVLTNTAALPAAPDGRLGLLNATQMRDLGLSRRTVESKRELLDAYNLPATVLREDTTGSRALLAYRFTLKGSIDGGVKESLGRILDEAIRNKATHFFLILEAAGGDPQAARELAERLIDAQQGDAGMRIVAYIPDRAPDTAAIVALGCSDIVMSKKKDGPGDGIEAELGDFDTVTGKSMSNPANAALWTASLRELAEKQGYAPLLAEAMLMPDTSVVRVSKKTDRRTKTLLTQAQFEEDKAKGAAGEWDLEKQIKAKGTPFKISASLAEDLGLARFTTDNREPDECFAKYGIDPSKVRDATPAWLDKFANFLRNPMVTVLLVVIGFTGLILELKVPGTAVPGIVAALCFILVFWAHTQFSGQVAVLAGLLFVFGLILVLMEVFILPGFGVPGIVGVILMLGSLGLATVTTSGGGLPSNPAEWVNLGGKMATYMFGMMGAVILAFVIARFLPNVPYFNRLRLAPPGENLLDEPSALPGIAEAASLLGEVGTTATVLRPAGSVLFDEQLVDVVSDGGYVPAGVRVQVVLVEGTRIVVKVV